MNFFYSWFCKVYKNVIIPAINHYFYFLNKTCITIFFHLSLALQQQSHSGDYRGDTGVTAVGTPRWPCGNAESPSASPSVRLKASFSPTEGIFAVSTGTAGRKFQPMCNLRIASSVQCPLGGWCGNKRVEKSFSVHWLNQTGSSALSPKARLGSERSTFGVWRLRGPNNGTALLFSNGSFHHHRHEEVAPAGGDVTVTSLRGQGVQGVGHPKCHRKENRA